MGSRRPPRPAPPRRAPSERSAAWSSIAPVHTLGIPPILPAAKVAPAAHKHAVVKIAPKTQHTAVLPVHESTPAVTPRRHPRGDREQARRRPHAGSPAVHPLPAARDKRDEGEAAAASHSRDRIGAKPARRDSRVTLTCVERDNPRHGRSVGWQLRQRPWAWVRAPAPGDSDHAGIGGGPDPGRKPGQR